MIYTITLNPSIDYIMQLKQLEIGKTNRSIKEYQLPGGKGINVSRILHQLEIPTTALGFLGGFTGDFIENFLINEGILCDFTRINEQTRINVKVKTTEESEINAAGPHISSKECQQFQKKLTMINKQDFVVLSGSLPSSLSPHFYHEIIQQFHMRQIPFALDTTGKPLLENLSLHPFLIKPNKEELEDLVGVPLPHTTQIIEAAHTLIKKGAQNVLVSLGQEGAVLVNEKETIHCPAPKGTLKNSVGAGDSMVAGFIGSYIKHQDRKKALQLGIACGSATAFSEDLAHKAEIMALLQQIEQERRNYDENN